ncbi:MAG TPA: hypothetical protein VK753_04990 [Xanthomonadaceae bacterium]|jgi:hypothetical protein|nr:hypothetical protein [Xanthomonadaceae bacterium]
MKDGPIENSTNQNPRPTNARAIRKIAKAEEELGRERELFEKKAARIESRMMNRDPITGAPGSHGLSTSVGTTGGAVAGVAIGSLAGPVGTAVGGFLGAIIGALAGHGVGEAFNPTAEEAYWRDMYGADTRYHLAHPYEDYAPAFMAGYLYRDRPWSEAESELRTIWERHKGNSPLSWEDTRDAARAAWLHADRRNATGDS